MPKGPPGVQHDGRIYTRGCNTSTICIIIHLSRVRWQSDPVHFQPFCILVARCSYVQVNYRSTINPRLPTLSPLHPNNPCPGRGRTELSFDEKISVYIDIKYSYYMLRKKNYFLNNSLKRYIITCAREKFCVPTQEFSIIYSTFSLIFYFIFFSAFRSTYNNTRNIIPTVLCNILLSSV